MNNLPIVCTLTPATKAIRRARLLPALIGRAVERTATSDGYRLRFAASGDTLQAIASTIDAERQCCRFLRFEVSVEPDGGPIWLVLTGPTGTRDFLDALLES